MCRERLYGVLCLPNGRGASKTCDYGPSMLSVTGTDPGVCRWANAGFLMEKDETPGSVYGLCQTRQTKITKEAFLSGSQRENPYPYQGL